MDFNTELQKGKVMETGMTYYVAPDGDDRSPGTMERPFASWERARKAVTEVNKETETNGRITVYFRGGTYELPATLVFTSVDSGREQAPVVYSAYGDEEVVISGGVTLKLEWSEFRDGIMKAHVPGGTATDQLFVNGMRLKMARYPNVQEAEQVWDGYAEDCIDPERVDRWSRPAGGFIHTLHKHGWGGFHYRIMGKDENGNLITEGGWQNNRQMGMHNKYRFVENIFEELDAPGEWFLDSESRMLYVYPPEGVELSRAHVEAVRLKHLIEFQGSSDNPIRHVHLVGFTFRRTTRTFMETKEPLLRSDWTIYRGGAIMFQGAEQCGLEHCYIDSPGGNAIFVSGYNRRLSIRECRIEEAGASGVALVGEPSAVRSPLFEYGERHRFGDIDTTPGPQSEAYPSDCIVEDCLISRTGRIEKQSAGVHISMAQHITIRHCSIYDMPRAGINISEGTWGGHVIEYCDVFDTVKETSDHGAFNSWGRDRYWGLKDYDLHALNGSAEERSELPLLDAVKPNVIRYNRWCTERGWDIDLDDGSSHYEIVGNLCLKGGIKLREGFYRNCENNITVNNTVHPHVWYRGSRDTIRRNIIFAPYKPIRVEQPWGDECDCNLLHDPERTESASAELLQRLSGADVHSLTGDALFECPQEGDYRVKLHSPAIGLGFENFPMDRFGTRNERLRKIARSPEFPAYEASAYKKAEREDKRLKWEGALLKHVMSLGEVSAYGLPEMSGMIVLEVDPFSAAARAGLQPGDVITEIDGQTADSTGNWRGRRGHDALRLAGYRNQRFTEWSIE